VTFPEAGVVPSAQPPPSTPIRWGFGGLAFGGRVGWLSRWIKTRRGARLRGFGVFRRRD